MKASLQLNTNQHLILTPQLKQALKLLQLSAVELQQEIQQQIDMNPMLEVAANEDISGSDEQAELSRLELEAYQWSYLYSADHKLSKSFNENNFPYDTHYCTTLNLRDHLLWQLNLSSMTELDRIIASTIIDAMDDNGFLTIPCHELYKPLIQSLKSIDVKDCEAVRHSIQQLDPIGCAAENLAETLLVQLQQLPKSTPRLDLARCIIKDHLNTLAQHQYSSLLKILHISETELSAARKLILHLNPNPGSVIQQPSSDFITPDLIVKKVNGTWTTELNPQLLPKLSINQYYLSLINHTSNRSDNQFLRNHLKEARCFLKNIQNRQETLLNVARYIVQLQHAFFDLGEQSMKPLLLKDVAQALQLHVSTISRVITQKFIHTPRGLFELKYFFSPSIPSTKQPQSAISIRAMIKHVIAKENPSKTLSDNKILEILLQQGIQITRSTIAKYRATLGIPPAYKRKALQPSFQT
jgi:RNA polymerase sigma-54 factor